MSKKGQQWCAVPGCMSVDKDTKRHFFRFPKEHDRWLKWIKASKRLDLELKRPAYAYRNCTMCHFHFEEKWLIRKTIMRLHPDAIPAIFFGPVFNRDDTQYVKNESIDVIGNCINISNVDANSNAKNNMGANNMTAVNAEAEQSTSKNTRKTKKSSDRSRRKGRLLKQVKLSQKNKLRQIVPRLRLKQEKKKTKMIM